jgi:hypothetical protein
MRTAAAAPLFAVLSVAAGLVAAAAPATAQTPSASPPSASLLPGVPTNCWVDMPSGGALVIPNAVTFNQCEAAAIQCLGQQPHGIVHHTTRPHVVASNALAECEANGQ